MFDMFFFHLLQQRVIIAGRDVGHHIKPLRPAAHEQHHPLLIEDILAAARHLGDHPVRIPAGHVDHFLQFHALIGQCGLGLFKGEADKRRDYDRHRSIGKDNGHGPSRSHRHGRIRGLEKDAVIGHILSFFILSDHERQPFLRRQLFCLLHVEARQVGTGNRRFVGQKELDGKRKWQERRRRTPPAHRGVVLSHFIVFSVRQ